MTAIERTAYPRFKQSLTQRELEEFYAPTEAEVVFVHQAATGKPPQLALMILLKSFQKLGYLPRLSQVPEPIQTHIAQRMGWLLSPELHDVPRTMRHRYRQAIHDYLDIKPYRAGGAVVVEQIVRRTAQTMSDPADLINVAIEQLIVDRFALPAYSTLDELVNHIRHQVHQHLYDQVTANLTQGQSEVVFGLAYLLGIKLMPRMRNWNKVAMYRPERTIAYQHIDAWFTRHVNWSLIEDHWPDMMQVVLSIHQGKILPSWLPQKLTTHNPKNRLYLAFRELGCAIRTMFLLEYASSPPLRRQIRAATTKIEAYNHFSDWIFFGGDAILQSRDPVEYEKRIKYKDLVANALMLQNVADMTDVLHGMVQEGYAVTVETAATFSPYLTEHIKRFGEYVIDTETIPPPLQPNKPFLTPVEVSK